MKPEKFIIKYWGKQGKRVIKACKSINAQPMTFKDFLNHCTACGGNWGGMLLTGINKLYPHVYNTIPDDMGIFAWGCITSVLTLLNITEE